MKTKTLLAIPALAFVISTFGQKPAVELTFTAENNGQYVPLDSILIKNLTQGGDTTLYVPDTVLVLDYITSIENSQAIGERAFVLSQNRPNPFKGKTDVNLYLPEKEHIKMTVRDILGRELAQYKNTLNQGSNSFAFYSGNQKYYFLTVTGKQTSKTIKMIDAGGNIDNSGKCKIFYTGNKGKMNDFKAQQAINDLEFSLGDSLRYTGYAKSIDGIFGSAVIQHNPLEDTIYIFDILKGLRCHGMPTITDIDGNTYNTVQIGSQCWMKENLKTTTYRNGTPIPNVTNGSSWGNLTTGAYVWYDNDTIWKDKYGALYNWYATVDTNGLCPTGWHVPTDDEWTDLTDYIGGTGSPHGNELKSCRQVNSPEGGGCNTTEHPRWNEDSNDWGTDDYGFSGLPGGARYPNGPFYDFGYNGNWWSSTEHSSNYAWARDLSYYYGSVYVYDSKLHDGFSVRCLRD